MPSPTIKDLADFEMERSVLFGLMMFPENLDLVDFRRHHFADNRNAEIFSAVVEMRADGETIDVGSVWRWIQANGREGKCGGALYVVCIDTFGFSESTKGGLPAPPFAIEDFTRCWSYLENLRLKRQILAISSQLRAKAGSEDQKAVDIIASAQEALGELGRGALSETVDIGPELCDAAATYESAKPGHSLGISTGIDKLDEHTNGCLPGQLVIVAGRPGMGKTSFALGMAADQSLIDRVPVVFFSLEMTKTEMVARMMQWATQIPGKKFLHGYASREERERLKAWARAHRDIPLKINDRSSARCSEIVAEIRRLHGHGKCRVAFIDHLGFVIPDKATENEALDIQTITRAFKALAKDLGITIVVLSQLNRGSERRGNDRRPILSDLRSSGAIEQDADVVVFVYRDYVYRPDDESLRNMAELIVAKCRDGETGIVKCVFIPETTTFRDMDRRNS